MPFTAAGAKKMLEHFLKISALPEPTHVYVALLTAPGVETSGSGYARVICDSWAEVSGGLSTNTVAVVFPQAGSSWGTIGYVGISDSLSGDIVTYGPLSMSRSIAAGTNPKFNIGELQVQGLLS